MKKPKKSFPPRKAPGGPKTKSAAAKRPPARRAPPGKEAPPARAPAKSKPVPKIPLAETSAASITKTDVARIFEEMSEILDILGENSFKVRAYQNAARAIESLPGELGDMLESGTLLDVKGIGKAIFSHIEELVHTGRLGIFEEAKNQIPAGLLDLLRIPGMGPKKVKAVYEKLGVQSIDDLERAANDNKVAELDGFGSRTQMKILYGIQSVRKFSERHLLHTAMEEARGIYDEISAHPGVQRALLGGSLRRHRETIKDIDIVVSARDPDPIMERFTTLPRVASVAAKGKTKSSVVLKSGINADLRVVSDDEFPFAAHYFTGSKDHNTEVRARAKKMGYKLNEYGLFEGETAVPCKDEKAIYRTLGLDYIPPELREAQGEIEAAEHHQLPELITEGDVRGLFHVHTTESDGTATAEEMARGAQAMGFEYLGIADHSRSAGYAGGLSIERVKAQAKEIKKLNERMKNFRVFHGIESDILPDGSLDYPPDVLELLDFIVISVHQNFRMSESEMTRRITRAIENPFTTILGHPTGRLLLAREPYQVDVPALIEAASRSGVVIEINANPHRLDLDWRFHRLAKEKGVKIAICPDSHTVKGMEDFRYGVGVARKGWLTRNDVINCLDRRGVEALLRSMKKDRRS
jgi:DNA polymerase (family 10)